MPRWLKWGLIALVVFFVATQPQTAGNVAVSLLHFGEKLGNGIGVVVSRLTK